MQSQKGFRYFTGAEPAKNKKINHYTMELCHKSTNELLEMKVADEREHFSSSYITWKTELRCPV